jgi:hypothetical protein
LLRLLCSCCGSIFAFVDQKNIRSRTWFAFPLNLIKGLTRTFLNACANSRVKLMVSDDLFGEHFPLFKHFNSVTHYQVKVLSFMFTLPLSIIMDHERLLWFCILVGRKACRCVFVEFVVIDCCLVERCSFSRTSWRFSVHGFTFLQLCT